MVSSNGATGKRKNKRRKKRKERTGQKERREKGREKIRPPVVGIKHPRISVRVPESLPNKTDHQKKKKKKFNIITLRRSSQSSPSATSSASYTEKASLPSRLFLGLSLSSGPTQGGVRAATMTIKYSTDTQRRVVSSAVFLCIGLYWWHRQRMAPKPGGPGPPPTWTSSSGRRKKWRSIASFSLNSKNCSLSSSLPSGTAPSISPLATATDEKP